MKLKNKIYCWKGETLQGLHSSGEITAQSLNLARLQLHKKGIISSTIYKKKVFFFSRNPRISSLDIVLFFRQLSTLILAGIPLSHAIDLFVKNPEYLKLLSILTILKEDITAGKELSYSLKKFPRHFDEMTVSLIYAGERSGTLDIMLQRIAHHKEKNIALKNKIQQALLYPAVITFTAILVTFIMLLVVVPRFAELFDSLHATLPAFTRYIISFANFLRTYFWLPLLLGCGIAWFLYLTKRIHFLKHKLDLWFLSCPGLSLIIKKIIHARFARALSTLLRAGLSITDAISIAMGTTGNSIYSKAIQKLGLSISFGKQLHVAMRLDAVFPPLMLQMVQVGEESGKLDMMLEKIADIYETDIDHLVSHLSRLLEPLIMLILGVLIGALVIAMYLPIFKLGTVI